MLDDERLTVKLPDLDHSEHRVNRWPIDFGTRQVDLDRQVGVGKIGRVVRLAGEGIPRDSQLFGVEVVNSPSPLALIITHNYSRSLLPA